MVGRTRPQFLDEKQAGPPPPSCRNPCNCLGGNNHSPCCLHPDARGSPQPLPPSQTALKLECLYPPPPGPGVSWMSSWGACSEGIKSLGLGWVVVEPGSHLPAVRGPTGGFLGVRPAQSGRGAPGPAKFVYHTQCCSEVSRRPLRGSGSGPHSCSWLAPPCLLLSLLPRVPQHPGHWAGDVAPQPGAPETAGPWYPTRRVKSRGCCPPPGRPPPPPPGKAGAPPA